MSFSSDAPWNEGTWISLWKGHISLCLTLTQKIIKKIIWLNLLNAILAIVFQINFLNKGKFMVVYSAMSEWQCFTSTSLGTNIYYSWKLCHMFSVLGCGAFVRRLSHEGGALVNEISALITSDQKTLLPLSLCEVTVERWPPGRTWGPHQTLILSAPWSCTA